MRSYRIGVILSVCLLAVPAWSQQSQTTSIPTAAPQDPQAANILKQALAVAGGAAAITAITDYTGTGNIVYNSNPQVQGSVTVQGLGLNECRLDANLPNGVRSWVVTAGQMTQKGENSFAQLIHSQIAMHLGGLVVPYQEVYFALNSLAYGISNNGLTQVNGHSVYDIQVQLVGSGLKRPSNLADFYVRDYFIDATTFQVLMTQDLAPKHVIRQLQYSDFTPVNGVLVPFSITEMVGGEQTWSIQLSQITFNTGLQDTAFALQ